MCLHPAPRRRQCPSSGLLMPLIVTCEFFCQIDASHDSTLHEKPAKRSKQLHACSPEALQCVSEDPYVCAPLVCTESRVLTMKGPSCVQIRSNKINYILCSPLRLPLFPLSPLWAKVFHIVSILAIRLKVVHQIFHMYQRQLIRLVSMALHL